MNQIPRAIIDSLVTDIESFEDLLNRHDADAARDRVKRAASREQRQSLHGVKKHAPMLANTIAPGVDVDRYLGVTLGHGDRIINYPMGS